MDLLLSRFVTVKKVFRDIRQCDLTSNGDLLEVFDANWTFVSV